jgi:Zn-finger domain-containing protein
MPTDALKSIMKYSDIIQVLRQELRSQLQELGKHEANFIFFSSPFDVNVETVSVQFELQNIYLR